MVNPVNNGLCVIPHETFVINFTLTLKTLTRNVYLRFYCIKKLCDGSKKNSRNSQIKAACY